MRKWIAVTACAVFAACGGDSSTQASVSIVGTYSLAAVNGSPLPFVFRAAEPKIEILSDELIVNAGGTFSENTAIRVTDEAVVTMQNVPDGGTYIISGTDATFIFNDGSIGTATVGTNRLTVQQEGFMFVYTK